VETGRILISWRIVSCLLAVWVLLSVHAKAEQGTVVSVPSKPGAVCREGQNLLEELKQELQAFRDVTERIATFSEDDLPASVTENELESLLSGDGA